MKRLFETPLSVWTVHVHGAGLEPGRSALYPFNPSGSGSLECSDNAHQDRHWACVHHES